MGDDLKRPFMNRRDGGKHSYKNKQIFFVFICCCPWVADGLRKGGADTDFLFCQRLPVSAADELPEPVS
jgi:hypothetical protein